MLLDFISFTHKVEIIFLFLSFFLPSFLCVDLLLLYTLTQGKLLERWPDVSCDTLLPGFLKLYNWKMYFSQVHPCIGNNAKKRKQRNISPYDTGYIIKQTHFRRLTHWSYCCCSMWKNEKPEANCSFYLYCAFYLFNLHLKSKGYRSWPSKAFCILFLPLSLSLSLFLSFPLFLHHVHILIPSEILCRRLMYTFMSSDAFYSWFNPNPVT